MGHEFAKGAALGAATAFGITAIYHFFRRKSSSERTVTRKTAEIPKELHDEQLSRHTLFFGEDGMNRLLNARILVVGLGGVGSHAAIMLARGGAGYLRLVDFDQVSLSSLNRHACATLEDVGTPKTTCLEKFCRKIRPQAEIDGHVLMFREETAKELMEGTFDLVLDCIDDVPTKALLIKECMDRKIPCVSCMAAGGGKADPTRLHISDLRSASRDPLATKLRQNLKKLLKGQHSDYTDNMNKITVVFSSEKTQVGLADFTDEQRKQGVHNFGAVDGMRIRVLPVLGTMPAIMGQSIAAISCCKLGQREFQPVTGERVSKMVRHKLFQHLQNREQELLEKHTPAGTEVAQDGMVVTTQDGESIWIGRLQIEMDDVEYLMHVWRNRCALTQARLGATLRLARWNLGRPSTCDNLLLVSASALKRWQAGQPVTSEVARVIEERLKTCSNDGFCN